MTEQTSLTGAEHAEIFAEAAARIQEGEPLEVVLASYPAAYRRNLRDLLAVVALANEINQVAVPALSPNRQSARKAAFLAAAQRFQAEQEVIASLRPPPVTAFGAPAPHREMPSVLAWWRDLFALPGLRPAAAALSAVLILLFSTTLVTLAEAAAPGDLSYPVKQWIRSQQLYLVPEQERPTVRAAQEQELILDVQKAQQQADLRNVTITAESELLFHGYGAGYLNIGDLVVLPLHQPDPNAPEFIDMSVIGELQPGATVRLRYQILPGQQAAHGPRVVQGISIEVIQARQLEPTPLPKETLLPPPTPTAVGAPPRPACTVTTRQGWVPYQVRIGDTLTAIANRTGTGVDDLRATNCLANDLIMAGRNLLVPATAPEPTVAAPTIATAAPTTLAPPAATAIVTATTFPPPETPEALTSTPGAPLTVTTPAPTISLTATPDGEEPIATPVQSTITPTVPLTTGTPAGSTPDEPTATRPISETVTVDPDSTSVATSMPVTGTVEPATPEPGETPEPATPELGETPEPAEPTTEAETSTPLPEDTPPEDTPEEAGPTPTPTATPAVLSPEEPADSTPDTGGASLPDPSATAQETPDTGSNEPPPTTDAALPGDAPTAATTSTAPEPAPPTAKSAPSTPQPDPPTPVPPTQPPTQPPPTQPPPTQPPPTQAPAQPPPAQPTQPPSDAPTPAPPDDSEP